jgi:ribosomal protein S18 acetylase RimI-like enzyme
MAVKIRPGVLDDLPFLKEMLFEAAYWRPNQARPSLEAGLARPDLAYLLADWGREGDTAVIAFTDNKQQIGAAWYRFWGPEQHSYGYVSPEIPELAIAVRAEYRGMGIGHRLLDEIFKMAVSQGVEKISLSVEIENPALHLYHGHGFEPIQKNEGDWIMIAVANSK